MNHFLLLMILLLSIPASAIAGQPEPSVISSPQFCLDQNRDGEAKLIPYSEMPESLPGKWKVSICVRSPCHAWLRYENANTKQVVTVSRFQYLTGARFDLMKLRFTHKPVIDAGVWMNRELEYEEKVKAGDYLMISTFVDNPRIILGQNEGRGHGSIFNNCATYCRDAWQVYTGEYYQFDRLHTPAELRNAIIRQHPEVLETGWSTIVGSLMP